MIKKILVFIFILLIPSLLHAGAEDIQITGEWRLSHPGYYISSNYTGERTWGAFNQDGTKILMFEGKEYTHPTYGTTGRGLVVGKISNLKAWTTLAEYQSAAKTIPDSIHITTTTSIFWSPLTGEENILYASFYSGSNCSYIKKLDVGTWLDGGAEPSWSNVVSVATGTTECRLMDCMGWTSDQKLWCPLGLESTANTYNYSGIYAYIINVQAGTKTNVTSWSARCPNDQPSSDSIRHVVGWPTNIRSHGHAARNFDVVGVTNDDRFVDRCSTTTGTNFCLFNYSTCSYVLNNSGNPDCTHFSWKSDNDWLLCNSGVTGTYTSPGLETQYIRQVYVNSNPQTYNTVKTLSSARYWTSGGINYNFSGLPLVTLYQGGGKLVYQSTLGKYSIDDYIQQGKTPWDMVSLNLIEFTNAGGSDTTPPELPSPEGFTATAQSSSVIKLEWSPCTDTVGVTKYKGWRKISGGSYPTDPLFEVAVSVFYDSIGLSPDTTYVYKLQCLDAAENYVQFTTEPSDATDALSSSDYTVLKKPSGITVTPEGTVTQAEWGTANILSITPLGGGNTLKVRGYWDATNLYLSFSTADNSNSVASSWSADDTWLANADTVEVFICTEADGGGASAPDTDYMEADDYHWIIDVNGYLWDGQGSDVTPTVSTSTWDCATCTKGVAKFNDRYSVELVIPWAEIGGAPSDDGTKKMSFAIYDSDSSTSLTWYMWGDYTNTFSNASKWKTVTFSGTEAQIPVSFAVGSGCTITVDSGGTISPQGMW